MARSTSVLGAVGAAAAVAALAACDSSAPVSSTPGSMAVVEGGADSGMFHGVELPRPLHIPDVTLTATDGEPFNLVADATSPVTLVFFGYTNCPDVCPLVMSDLTLAYAELPAAVQARTQVLFITTDPARDTAEVLRRYLARYNPSFVGLTGGVDRIIRAARDLGVAMTGRKALPDGGYDVGHGAQVIGFARQSAPVIWTPGTPVRDMAADIMTLAGS
jgi:protein SCO1/2